MGDTLCGSVVVLAIANTHTPDNSTDSFSLRFLYGIKYVLQTPFYAIRVGHLLQWHTILL